jgi:hypothetical protein
MILACKKCNKLIPYGRREALPGIDTCVKCSETKAYVGFMVFPHKTGGSVNIVNPNRDNAETTLEIARRAHKRSR